MKHVLQTSVARRGAVVNRGVFVLLGGPREDTVRIAHAAATARVTP